MLLHSDRLAPIVICIWLLWIVETVASGLPTFTWAWGSSDQPSECSVMGIVVNEAQMFSNPLAQAPFYMIAYPNGGVASVSFIGLQSSSLQWQVMYGAGTQLLLQVVDANGNTGGVGPLIYPVLSGSTDCTHVATKSPIAITTPAHALSTCDPFMLNITGGTKPYTVSLVGQGAPVATNVTLGPNDDWFNYINRATPSQGGNAAANDVLLAAVSDATGEYGISTSFIPLSGGTNTTCNDAVSSSGSSDSSSSEGTSPTTTKKRTGIGLFVGVALGILSALFLASWGLLITLRWLKRRKSGRSSLWERRRRNNATGVSGDSLRVALIGSPRRDVFHTPSSSQFQLGVISPLAAQFENEYPYRDSSNTSTPGFPAYPASASLSPPRGPLMAEFSASAANVTLTEENPPLVSISESAEAVNVIRQPPPIAGHSSSNQNTTIIHDDSTNVDVIQHKDGGPLELPPAYNARFKQSFLRNTRKYVIVD